MRAGLFFAGTDTGVGKTFVTAWVVRRLRSQGIVVAVRKPVLTGTGPDDDSRRLAEAAGDEPSRVTRWSFAEPAAPPVAARSEGVRLTLDGLASAARDGVTDDAVLLVEGVGGLLCPLTETETVADLAAVLGLPVVLVACRSLGTLSRTLLTVEVARHRRLPLVGVVVSETRPSRTLAEDTNVAELRDRLSVPLLAVARHGPGPQPELEAVDWLRLGRDIP